MALKNFFKPFIWIIYILYLAVVLKLILFKRPLGYIKTHFSHDYDLASIKLNLGQANFIPFHTIQLYLKTNLRAEYSIENLLGNIIIFIPLGLLTPLLFKGARSFRKVFGISFLISFILETIQLLAVLGRFDVDDVILNTAGGVLGYLGFKLFLQRRVE